MLAMLCAQHGGEFDQSDVDLRVHRSQNDVGEGFDSRAAGTFNAELESWKSMLPSDPEALWAFMHGDQETLLKLLAVLIAPGIDLRTAPNSDQSSFCIGDVMAAAMGLDMSAWWSATPESFFEHVRKDVIVDAIIEVKPTLDRAKLEKVSKAELVSRAKRIFKGSPWLPEPLRMYSSPLATVAAIAAEQSSNHPG